MCILKIFNNSNELPSLFGYDWFIFDIWNANYYVEFTLLFVVIRHLKKEHVFHCQMLSDIFDSDDVGTVVLLWNIGFYFIWKSQYIYCIITLITGKTWPIYYLVLLESCQIMIHRNGSTESTIIHQKSWEEILMTVKPSLLVSL